MKLLLRVLLLFVLLGGGVGELCAGVANSGGGVAGGFQFLEKNQDKAVTIRSLHTASQNAERFSGFIKKLKSLPDEQQAEFLVDVARQNVPGVPAGAHLSENMASLDAGMVESWIAFKNAGLNDLAVNTAQLEKFNSLVKNNNLGLDANGLENILKARTATNNLQWEHPEIILDAVKRASDANIEDLVIKIKAFPTPSEGNTSFILNNAKQYQLEASGDAFLSFEKGGRSFDNVTPDGVLIDRKYGHGSSVFNADASVKNEARAKSILEQGRAQITAANGTPVRWEVSTELGADGIQSLFDARGIDIEVVYVPQQTIIN